MTKKSKRKKLKKYFIKNDEGLHVVESSFFDSIQSWSEALSLGILCFCEIQRVLSEDAIDDSDSYIGNMKVVTGLERSLCELSERYPGLSDGVKTLPIMSNGRRVFRS